MLIRISLVIAILAGIAVGVLNFVQVKEKITVLTTDRNTQKTDKEVAQKNLATKTKELEVTTKELVATKQSLTDMTGERDKALAEAESQSKKASELAGKLTKTIEERDGARQELASYKGTGFTPGQIVAFGKQLKDTQDALDVAIVEKKILSRQIVKLEAKLAIYEGKGPITMPGALKGKIVVTDPKWEFVVLDVGDDAGVVENGEMLVSRGGKLVGKVIVRSVQKDRSIANVVPGWKLTEIMEEDQVIAAHPATQ